MYKGMCFGINKMQYAWLFHKWDNKYTATPSKSMPWIYEATAWLLYYVGRTNSILNS
jgi:hypothetical protein